VHRTLLWYDPELCWDHLHLNAPGVAIYMPVLATEVREALETTNPFKRGHPEATRSAARPYQQFGLLGHRHVDAVKGRR
jgi:hypothetical protein